MDLECVVAHLLHRVCPTQTRVLVVVEGAVGENRILETVGALDLKVDPVSGDRTSACRDLRTEVEQELLSAVLPFTARGRCMGLKRRTLPIEVALPLAA